MWSDQLLVCGDGELGCIFELSRVSGISTELRADSEPAKSYDMGDGLAAIHVLLHYPILINSDRGEHVEGVLVAGLDPIKHQAHDYLLPGRASLVPEFRLFQIDDIAHILHDAVQRAGGQHLILIVVGDGNEQLGVAVIDGRAQIIPVPQGELVGVAGGRGVWDMSVEMHRGRRQGGLQPTSHMGEFLREGLLRLAVLGLDGILDRTRHGVVDAQHGALHQVDLAGAIAAQAARAPADAGLLPGIQVDGVLVRHVGVVDVGRLGFLVRGRGEDGDAGIVKGVAT